MVSSNLRYEGSSSPAFCETSSVDADVPTTGNGYPKFEADQGSNGSTIADEEPYDLICVGFGPASLAIAIALHDRGLSASTRVLFIERQDKFAWHAGMLLPGSRMQISFIKDLATLRDPRSHFTFVNYLHKNNRLVSFTNLGTFLPLRKEYNDYLTWCARHFDDRVHYSETVTSVDPIRQSASSPATGFEVHSINADGNTRTRTARHVVVAVGGKPNIPLVFPSGDKRVIHSSQYVYTAPTLLKDVNAPYKVAVIGGGQSAAEIFEDLRSRYPNCQTRLIFKAQALKPSDDSPFVNEIFNPEKVDGVFALPADVRAESLHSNKATNYGVVRLELLERIYEHFYEQRMQDDNEENWANQILPLTDITSVETNGPNGKLRLSLRNIRTGAVSYEDCDAVVVATGYSRNMHQTILQNTKHMLKKDAKTGIESWAVARDYKLQYEDGRVAADAGVWLQGCCEATHGLSDSLLSILAVRGGEMVDSIFGKAECSPDSPLPTPVAFTKSNGLLNGNTTNTKVAAPPAKEINPSKRQSTTTSPKKEAQSTWRNLGLRISGRK